MAFIGERRWIPQYPKEIPTHIHYEERLLQDYLQQAAEKYPRKKAIHFLGSTFTFAQLVDNALKVANDLHELGLKKGDRVSVMMRNCPQSVISYYGVLFAGGIVVPIDPHHSEDELKHQLADSGAKIMICEEMCYPKTSKVRKHTALEHVMITGLWDFLPFPRKMMYSPAHKRKRPFIVDVDFGDSGIHSFKKIIKNGEAVKPDIYIDPKEDIAVIQYTTGVYEPAKGVMLTHYNLVANMMQLCAWIYKAKEGEERILSVVPFFHMYGMTAVMNLSMMMAYEMILLPDFEAKEVLKTIDKQKPTLFPGVPAMYIELLNHPDVSAYDLSSLSTCISGLAPLPTEIQGSFEEMAKSRLIEGYGLAEASPMTHVNLLFGIRVNGSIGLPLPDTDAAILSLETGEIADIGELGELMVRGPQVTHGYWKQLEKSREVFHEDWLLTGDIGYIDEDGHFYILDRKKDRILSGGRHIFPHEIEEVLYKHDAVQEAVVIGIPNGGHDEAIKAFIVLKEGWMNGEKELDAFCRKHLPAHKVPEYYAFRSALPKSFAGRVLRNVLHNREEQMISRPKEKSD